MRRYRKGSPLLRMWMVACALVGFSSAVGAQSGEDGALEQLAPERAEAQVAPIATAVGGMPPLPAVSMEREAFDVPITVATLPPVDVPPPEIPQEAVTPAAMIPGEDQVYFNATLGGGSVNSILGSINVYRLGSGPQFRVGYDHRGSDGFNLEDPGTGFFVQENALDVWMRLGNDSPWMAEFDLGYADQRFGLQQLSPYYSEDLRSFSGRIEGGYVPSSRFGLRGVVAVEDAERVLATGDSGIEAQRNEYSRVTPRLISTLEWPRFRVELSGGYDGAVPTYMELGSTSDIDVQLGLEAVPFDGLTLGARASTVYRFGNGVAFPVGGYLNYRGNARWQLDLAGGYRVGANDPREYWERYPVTEIEPGVSLDVKTLPLDEVLYVGGALGLVVVPGFFELRGGLDREIHSDLLAPEAFDPASGAYPYRLDRYDVLRSEATGELSFGESVQVDVTWEGDWDDRLPGTAAHRIVGGIRGAVGDLTLEARGRAPLVRSGGVLPQLDLDFRYDIARDVELRLYANDILAPGMDDGRSLQGGVPDEDGPFIDAGLEVGAAVRVSF